MYNPYWDRSYPTVNHSHANKDIVREQWFNTDYLRCFVDIIEYSNNTEVARYPMQRFADESEMRDFVEANCANSWWYYTNHVVALFYDIVDISIQQISNIHPNNTFYNMLKGRHGEKRSWNQYSVISYPAVWWGGLQIQLSIYADFVQQAVRLMIPWMSWRTFNLSESPWMLFWLPSNYRKRYNLLNDEAVIRLHDWPRWFCDSSQVINYSFAHWISDWEDIQIIHSQSMYCVYGLWGSSFQFYSKNQSSAITSELKNWNSSILILYLLKYSSWGTDYYAIYAKPVMFDALFVSWFDDKEYELNIVKESRDRRPYLKTIACDINDVVGWQVKIHKWDWISDVFPPGIPTYWSENLGNKVRFLLRDRVTWKVSQLSRSCLKPEKWKRDKPLSVSIAVA